METTPKIITEKVIQLCNKVVTDSLPIFVAVIPDEIAKINECFHNVDNVIRRRGGYRINGWAIWQWDNKLVEAEAHAVWKSLDGVLLDVTPHRNGEKNILFLQDNNMIYNEENIDNIRMALTESPLVKEYISLSEEYIFLLSPYKPHEEIPYSALPKRFTEVCRRRQEISGIFHKVVERNDKCSCGSGIKYKKCCGK
ncbi:SEC-C metal-binding domain-containing protein [Lacrimispora sp.]|uniref:SEC-C metal-binding domain-containing protein n=1 Tax=Lacrimispora sp. TaxID=2719234 RepID=UPI0028999057|nr:SEC-C metal-binding domain-containing protein [Lacrimispora sp.]